jgi:4'-phosphopantetheinyl transferase
MILSYSFVETEKLNRKDARRLQSERAKEMLSAMLEDAGVAERKTARDDKGRPNLVGRDDVDFNISHSDGIVVCALAVGEGRVGVDVERSTPIVDENRLARFAKRYFHPDDKIDASGVISAWTEKEAYLKYLGVGLSLDLKSVRPRADPGVRFERTEIDGYCLTVCFDKKSSLETVRLFSREKG